MTKNIIISVLGLGVLLLFYYSCNNKREATTITDFYQPAQKVIIKRGVDSSEYAKVKQVALTASMLKHSNDSLIKSIRKYSKRSKNLKSITYVNNEVRGSIFVPVHDTLIDSSLVRKFNFNDKWLTLDGTVGIDTAGIKYNIRNEFVFVERLERSKWYKPKTSVILVHSKNPNTYTTGMTSYKVTPKQKKFYNTRVFNILVGVGIGMAVKN